MEIAIIVLILIFSVSAFVFFKIAGSKQTKLSNEIKELNEKIIFLGDQNQKLEKYKVILNADNAAKEILEGAQATATELVKLTKTESETILSNARAELNKAVLEANEMKTIASREVRANKDKSENMLNSATAEAGKIIENANKRAEEIAGDAYSAMKNAELYEKTVRAMKNKIEGYGDQYIIPSHSILDDLAEGYGHTEAGEELKKARDRTRFMIKNETAATCEYVENNRKETAINFVLDAFNGKIDSILSRAKHDNIGNLQQEIKDAFNLVNFNGKAFRNAVITEEYLSSRLDELKWAVAVNELRLQEREEQRRIKEQIREEEKAKREYERAIKETEKEEEYLKKAMEKVQKEVEKASDSQKSKYEEQLKELEEKLKAAEEKNKRALSMAQQTKTGHVYIISNIGSLGEDVYKIGLTRRLEPLDRIRELGDASVPFEFDVHAMILSEDAPKLERDLHKKFIQAQVNKVNHRKEFFRINIGNIKQEIEKIGISAKWTLTSEAMQYRETKAIEKMMENNPKKQDEWTRQQLRLDPTENIIMEEEEI